MKRYPFIFLLLTIVTVILVISSASPPGIITREAPDTVFSAERAYKYLQQIAREPHSIGTAEHARVREYIINTFRELGLSPSIQHTTFVDRYGETLHAATVSNIIVTVKGSLPGKAILMAAHYDSQPNTPGAGDDGMGVSAMLETARALKHLHPLQNDVVFLISDGEEEGLFGAKAFVAEYPSLKDIAVVINWDFRGNSGITIAYETSAENGWLMKQYAKGAIYPSASSMAYEVSKRIPNDADFTPFKKTGVTGFANGALGGFVNYHSMTDKAEKLDLRTLQQAGSNMLGLLKQTGNESLANTKAPDLSYFNIAGFLFVFYPAGWNLIFIISASFLFTIALVYGFRRKQINLAGFLISFLLLPLICIIVYFVSAVALKAILGFYPLYSHFYENNSYNSQWYFLTMAILALLLFAIVYRPAYRRWGYNTVFAGTLLNIACFMWLSHIFVPSAAFLFTFPCLFLSTGFSVLTLVNNKYQPQSFRYNSLNFVSQLPGLFLFAPLCELLFVTFGLGEAMPFVSILVVLATALLFPVLQHVFNSRAFVVPSVLLALLLFSVCTAHINSGFDKKHPLHTNVRYRLNADDSTADWLSDYADTDKFSAKFFPDKKIDTAFKSFDRLIHPAPVLPYPAPVLLIIKDTAYEDRRELTLRGVPNRTGVNTMGIVFDDGSIFSRITINGKEAATGMQESDDKLVKSLVLYGAGQEGFEVKLAMKANNKPGMTLYDRSMGLPLLHKLTDYPEDIIPGTDFNCNTVMVKKHFSF